MRRFDLHSGALPVKAVCLAVALLMLLCIGAVAHAGIFTDDFNGPGLHALWEQYTPKPGPTVGFTNGALHLEIPVVTAYNHSKSVNNAPQIRLDAPAGNFTFETRLTLPVGTTGGYGAGICVLFGTNDMFTWGFAQKTTQVRLERTGTILGTASFTGNSVGLRVVKLSSQYRFYYQATPNGIWTLYQTQTTSNTPLKIGLYARTTSSYNLKADFESFKLDAAKFNVDLSQGWIKANILNGTDPVDGPWLLVKNAQGHQVAGIAHASVGGRAAVFNLSPGAYTVKAVNPWVDSSEVENVTVTAGQEASVDLQAVPCPNFSLLSNSPDVAALTGGVGWKLLPGPLGSDVGVNRSYLDPADLSYNATGTDSALTGTWLSGITVPKDYGQANIKNNSIFWYRLEMDFPASYSRFKSRNWVLTDYNIDDEDRTYFNGELIGSLAYQPQYHTQPWMEPRDYEFPGDLIQAGGKNVLAIQGFQGPGGAGMSISGPRLRAPSNSTSYIVLYGLGPEAAKTEKEVTITVTSLGGAYSESVYAEDGKAVFRWLPEGEYLVEFSRPAALDPAIPLRLTVKPNTFKDYFLSIPALPYWDLRSEKIELENRLGWTFMSITADKSGMAAGDDAPAGAEYPDTDEDATYGEDWFADTPAPVNLGVGEDPTLPIQNNSYFWYRIHLNIPMTWKTLEPGRDLLLSQFSVDDSDWTYFNGQLVGSTLSQPSLMRSYTISKDLVNWDGDNVIAIKGYNGVGNAGITNAGFFSLSMKPLETAFIPAKGDVDLNGLINVQDAALALQITVGLKTATEAQLLAGDIDNSGGIEVTDTVAILKFIVGLGTL